MAHHRERGATLVEMAVIFPLLLLVTVSIFEFGLAFKDHHTVTQGVRDGTRMLSAAGDDIDADCTAMERALDTMMASLDVDQVTAIEVFRANADGTQNTADTNRYTYLGGDPRDCANWNGTVAWPPSSRQVVAGSVPLDIVGIRIIYESGWVTGIPPFVGSLTIDRSSISRIEPEVFE